MQITDEQYRSARKLMLMAEEIQNSPMKPEGTTGNAPPLSAGSKGRDCIL